MCGMGRGWVYEGYGGVDGSGKGEKKGERIERRIDEVWGDMGWGVGGMEEKGGWMVSEM